MLCCTSYLTQPSAFYHVVYIILIYNYSTVIIIIILCIYTLQRSAVIFATVRWHVPHVDIVLTCNSVTVIVADLLLPIVDVLYFCQHLNVYTLPTF